MQRVPVGDRVDAQELSPDTALAGMLHQALQDVVSAELDDRGLRLSAVGRRERLSELEFALPAHRLSSSNLSRLLSEGGYGKVSVGQGSIEGYLRGAIDCVIQREGQFYLLDWKSNYLGSSRGDYEREALETAMQREGYHLQYLLYSLALHRYLAQRVPEYQYERHFGGCYYLFVRGMRRGWWQPGAPAGVYFARPAGSFIERLNGVIEGADR
jgi:exodeoxyribonuclease V beta subunit